MAVITPVAPRTGRLVELLLLLTAIGIAMAAWALVGLSTSGQVPANLLAYGAGLAGLTGLLHVVLRWRARWADPVLLPVAATLNGLGLVMIHRIDLAEGRTDAALAPRQLLWTAVGIVAATVIVAFLRDHRWLRRYTFTAMVAGLILLLLPLVPGLGRTINGARIWIGFGGLSFQPGELAKIVLAVFFAGYLVNNRDALALAGRNVLGFQFPRGRDLGPIVVAWAASLAVLVFERDLGSSLLFFGLFVAMLYVATQRVSWIAIGLALFAAGAFVAWTLFSHVQLRVQLWLDPYAPESIAVSDQVVRGTYGMASGGLLGTGLGQGRPDITPYAESDFIITAIGEELGLIGVFAVLVMFGILVERGLRIAIGVRDGFGKLLCAGLAFSIALQVFVVVGGVTRVIPLTGLTTPFLAYGGSSLVANWMIMGLLLRISDGARRPAPPVDTDPIDAPDAAATQVVRAVPAKETDAATAPTPVTGGGAR